VLAPEPHEQQGTVFDRETYFPVFSADGTQIAFFDGHGDWGHRLRVMNADGTGSRTLHESDNHVRGLAWSPDARRLIFSDDDGVWVIGIDGSGLTKVTGSFPAWTGYPSWSSDGSRIAYQQDRKLYIANADGTQATLVAHVSSGWGRSAQWNPLPLEGGAE
jgi:Tol biopolymer transport system component